jgi:hypothetical protein
MNRCQASCRGADQRAFRLAMRRDVFTACRDCAAWLTSQGLTLIPVERRSASVPVASDRRRFVPPWLRNLTARDETGAAA